MLLVFTFLVQFPVRFEKCWQLDLFLSTKSYVQVHKLHINGWGLNFWLTLRPTLMHPKKHVFHQLMYAPPPERWLLGGTLPKKYFAIS